MEIEGVGIEGGKKRKVFWFVCVWGFSVCYVKEEGIINFENESCEGGREDSIFCFR